MNDLLKSYQIALGEIATLTYEREEIIKQRDQWRKLAEFAMPQCRHRYMCFDMAVNRLCICGLDEARAQFSTLKGPAQ